MRISLPLVTLLATLASCASPSAATVAPAMEPSIPTIWAAEQPVTTPKATSSAPAAAPAQDPVPIADENYGPEDSSFLLSVAGSWSRQTFQLAEMEQETRQLNVGISYFLNRTHELGLTIGGQFIDSESTFSDGMGGFTTTRTEGETVFVNAIYNYNIYLTPRTGIYLGPQVGWSRFDSGVESTSEPQYGVRLGLRHWLHPRVAFTIEPQYTFIAFDDDVGGESDFYQILLGLAVTL